MATNLQKRKEQFHLDMQNIYNLTPDRWGNYKFTAHNGRQYRLKCQKQTIRFESKVVDRWMRMKTYSYGHIENNLNNHLIGAKQ